MVYGVQVGIPGLRSIGFRVRGEEFGALAFGLFGWICGNSGLKCKGLN